MRLDGNENRKTKPAPARKLPASGGDGGGSM
jgi:hypothetical protein